jgi:hypothetical protein
MVGYRRGYFNGPDGRGAVHDCGSIQHRNVAKKDAVISRESGNPGWSFLAAPAAVASAYIVAPKAAFGRHRASTRGSVPVACIFIQSNNVN